VQQDVRRAQRQAQQQGAASFEVETQGTSMKEAERLLACARKAGGDVEQIQACNEIVAP
jgi:L-alanine-DL-glutamate epimerase-like enolase superfamily enzyme